MASHKFDVGLDPTDHRKGYHFRLSETRGEPEITVWANGTLAGTFDKKTLLHVPGSHGSDRGAVDQAIAWWIANRRGGRPAPKPRKVVPRYTDDQLLAMLDRPLIVDPLPGERPQTRPPPTSSSDEPLTEQILRAANEISGHRRGVRVQLDKVRARFPGVPRAELDVGLRALHAAGRGILMHNDGGIGTATGPTPSEIAAALPIAFTPQHMMYVQDSPAPAAPSPAPAKPAAKKRAAKKPRGELQTIVLAWPEEDSELVRAGRVDLGERATFRTVIRGKAAMWARNGTADDIAKATIETKRPTSAGGNLARRVFLYPTTEPDPLGKARAAIERDAQKPPAVQTSAAQSSRPPISLRRAKPPRAATPTPDAFVKAFNAGLERAPLKMPAKKTPPIRAKKAAAKKATPSSRPYAAAVKASATIAHVRERRIDEAIARATARLCRAAARKTAKTRRGLSRRKP